MTKIYEALENASRGRETGGASLAAPTISGTVPKALEARLLSLSQRVNSVLKNCDCKVVEFAGAQKGTDSSRLACEYAKLEAARLNKKVLLLASGPFSYVNKLYARAGLHGWEAVLDDPGRFEEFIKPLDNIPLALGQISSSNAGVPSVLASPGFENIMERLKSEFDMIVIDAPGLAESTDAALLSSVADGVVIVLEAGGSRWQAVKSDIENLESQGGTVLGVVLNKRRDYIPGFIYRRL